MARKYLSSLDASSGKGRSDENFPVASWLIAKDKRPLVMCYYRFARFSDDIADNPSLDENEKLRRLKRLDDALLGRDTHPDCQCALDVAALMDKHGIDIAHARDLLKAFSQDATKKRYANWEELEDYCMHSASPVGRFLLSLHGEDKALFALSDPLCNALQILNHLQDCAKDYRTLDRVYMPQDVCKRYDAKVETLASRTSDVAWRRVFHSILDKAEPWINQSESLSSKVSSKRLAMEVATIFHIAQALSRALRKYHPLYRRVRLHTPTYIACFRKGIRDTLFFSKR
ncbi:MAG: squalene synthase HpnC [Alphaproteobacteria bacterium GM7ARS4]|nr:squalene synthase HpnC [Alphaproteobacteria bacterium GM7ARS4]